jgi:hypothetical protein
MIFIRLLCILSFFRLISESNKTCHPACLPEVSTRRPEQRLEEDAMQIATRNKLNCLTYSFCGQRSLLGESLVCANFSFRSSPDPTIGKRRSPDACHRPLFRMGQRLRRTLWQWAPGKQCARFPRQARSRDISLLYQDVLRFAGGTPQKDDLTAIVQLIKPGDLHSRTCVFRALLRIQWVSRLAICRRMAGVHEATFYER